MVRGSQECLAGPPQARRALPVQGRGLVLPWLPEVRRELQPVVVVAQRVLRSPWWPELRLRQSLGRRWVRLQAAQPLARPWGQLEVEALGPWLVPPKRCRMHPSPWPTREVQ